ncbi:F-box protein cpr30 [Phtheirospermum japonicum]|uniref:F-box protein cpr30 n=1 Tax=Phtheirospermum japonicum TaxID=374723 RepID=A0A830BCD1_9LAMI|nr:F-box protein cpr30 [Phtheirospermum japonicum]
MLDLGLLDNKNPKKARVSKTPFVGEEIQGISNTCDGLVVVTADLFGPLALWNPFLKRHVNFPDSPSKCSDPGYFPNVLYGLGYDSKNDDYKVVRNFEYKNIKTHQLVCSKTEVYTFKSNVWKEVQPFPCSLSYTYQLWVGPVNGSLHMLCTDKSRLHSKIVGFSVENENYFEMMFPKGTNNVMGLDLLGGCLSMACCNTESQINIWVMKEYGLRESWTNLISIVNPVCDNPSDCFKPLVYSEDGQKVLMYGNRSKFVWYDLKRKTMEKVKVGGVPYLIQLEPCVQSLIFPDVSKPRGVSEVNKVRQQLKEEKVKPKRDDFLSKGFKLKL